MTCINLLICVFQVKSYYGVVRNLLIKFRDDPIDETSALAQLLAANSAISSMQDLSIRTVPGDHGMPLQQVDLFKAFDPCILSSFFFAFFFFYFVGGTMNFPSFNLQVLPDVPPAMVDAVNRGSVLLANLTSGTPWETVARDFSSTLGMDSRFVAKDLDHLVDVISSWMYSSAGSKVLKT